MGEREPVLKTVTASEAREQWSALLNSVFERQARVIVEKSGIPMAAIISAHDLEQLNRAEERRRADVALLDASQAAFVGIPDEILDRTVSAALDQVRAQHRDSANRPPVLP